MKLNRDNISLLLVLIDPAGGGTCERSPWQKLDYASYYLGLAAVVPFSLLWIPVSRGSVLLRIAGIPFERAVRYHIWLANLMVLLLTLHSIGYIVYYYYT